MLLHKLGAGEAINKVQFHKVLFWVQIHGLPTISQTKEASVRIGSILGKVEKVDVENKGFCLGGYLCIRVTMDITQPLCRGRMVELRRGGLTLNTNGYPSSATGVVRLIMMNVTASNGFRVKKLSRRMINSSVLGCTHHRIAFRDHS